MPLTPAARPAAYGPEPRTRVSQNLQALGIVWCLYGGYRLLTLLSGLAALQSLQGSGALDGVPPFAFSLLHELAPVVVALVVVKAVLSVIVGLALLARKPWAREVAIVLGLWSLFKLPVGTALGIYTLWVLAPSTSGEEWRRLQGREALTAAHF